jgi:hypothetical protein
VIRLSLAWLHPRRWNLRLVWDVLMVWVALVNLWLIVFDLTYLVLRPHYFRWVPVVCRVWDPVKGIEPHPLTAEIIGEVNELKELLALDPTSATVPARLASLRALTVRMLEENPFERSGQARSQEVVRLTVAHELGAGTHDLAGSDRLAAAVERFWTDDPALLQRRIDTLFDQRLRPILAMNYFREFDLDGRLVDHFWLIDLPFLTLFVVEFAIRWSLAIRRRTYPRWFFFPITHWYDLLGLMPSTELRVFRLFRVASMYMRLRRSELSKVGKDVLSRGVAYVSNIIAEEISDTVALRILNETQEEIRDGTHLKIWDRAVASRRRKIEEVFVEQVRELVSNPATQERIRQLMRLNLETALARSDALDAVPLPNAILHPLVRSLGEIVLETTLETVSASLDSDEGQQATRDLVAAVMDQVLTGPGRDVVASLSEEISLDVIERMKEAVAVKKWALPDRRPEPPRLLDGTGREA